jgi:hypothetical protein
VLVAATWGIDPGWAQRAPISTPQNQQQMTNYQKLREELAAKRAAQGQMESTSPSQRKAAAERLKGTVETQQEQSSQSQAEQAPISTPQNQQQMTNYQKLREELAAKRAAQGQMRSTTPSQRKAAAKRLKATLEVQQEQSAPSSGTEVNKK